MKSAFILVIALMGGLSSRAQGLANDHFFTTALPEPDRAQIILSNTDKNIAAVLRGEDAHHLAALVRAQRIGDFGMRCNTPQYTIWFFQGDKVIACETVCFRCHWITPTRSDIHSISSAEGFDVKTPQAMELAAYLKKVAPAE